MRSSFVKYFFIVKSISFFLLCGASYAQISGIITDSKTGKPLSNVEVFINQTSIGTQSNEAGQFSLKDVVIGFHEIVLYKNEYSLYRSPIKIQVNRLYNLKLSLSASQKKKGTRPTPQESKNLKSALTGLSEGRSDIKILNDEGIRVSNSETQQTMITQPLVIENNATGYRLKFYAMETPLQDFSLAPLQYELLPSTEMQQIINWEKERKKYFIGSKRHWLMAAVANQLKEEGYSLFDQNGNEIDVKSLLSVSSLANYTKLTISNPLTIQFKREGDGIEISHVAANSSVDVSTVGLMINSKALTIEGNMAERLLANQLPIDYLPIAGNVEDTYSKTIERVYEKVYVHTDKPYYYPGEVIWFKGYINYKEPDWRDSLSNVMYVELINPNKKITLAKTLKIDSGFFANDFILPDTLTEGNYYLRAYTNLNLNFGDSVLFVKPIPVLKSTDKVDYTQGKTDTMENNLLKVSSDKKGYKTRERIILTLQTKDKNGSPSLANLSVSVTDAIQVVPITEPSNIMKDFPFENNMQKSISELKYPLESGVGFIGKFFNNSGRPEKVNLTILQMKPRNVILVESNDQGVFSLTGLDFYDTATFSFKADKAKDIPYGKVEIVKKEFPKMNFKESNYTIVTQSTQSPQRIISDYEVPKDVHLLKEIVVNEKRTEKVVDRVQRPYGRGDFVIEEKDIKKQYSDLLYTLAAAKTAGLYVNPAEKIVVFTRAATQSINFGAGPMVIVNNVAMTGSAGDILSQIDPNTVESIELTKRINVLYGSQGANGVIAVFTKTGVTDDGLKATPNFQAIKISGYSFSRRFQFPNYDEKDVDKSIADYRSTIYWNPNITSKASTGIATISFFAADLPGKYRIVAEGVNKIGEPIRSVTFVDVESE